MKTEKIDRLDRLLSEYEDQLWLMMQYEGADENLPEPLKLRGLLEKDDFPSMLEHSHLLYSLGSSYSTLLDTASMLSDWCHFSRRVFSISDALATMLINTELPEFPLGMTKFVATSFALQLENPIKMSNGTEHDFVMCSFNEEHGALMLHSIPQSCEKYQPLTDDLKKEMERYARNGSRRFEKFSDRYRRASRKTNVVGFSCCLREDGSLKDYISEAAPAGRKEDYLLIYNLVLGFNLYLQTKRSKDVEKEVKVFRSKSAGDRSSIFSSGKTSIFELSVSKESQASAGLLECGGSPLVTPHFRRGFWRRPNGQGSDSTAPATIWVRPTWVRKDLISDDCSKTGTKQKMNNLG